MYVCVKLFISAASSPRTLHQHLSISFSWKGQSHRTDILSLVAFIPLEILQYCLLSALFLGTDNRLHSAMSLSHCIETVYEERPTPTKSKRKGAVGQGDALRGKCYLASVQVVYLLHCDIQATGQCFDILWIEVITRDRHTSQLLARLSISSLNQFQQRYRLWIAAKFTEEDERPGHVFAATILKYVSFSLGDNYSKGVERLSILK